MDRAIRDIYEGGGTFRDQVARDLDDGAVWFDLDEFARFHDIDGAKVLSVFTSDTRSQRVDVRSMGDERTAGVYRSRGVLFVRAAEIEGVNAEQPLRLDGRLYTVADARLIQDQVWRIVLEANEP